MSADILLYALIAAGLIFWLKTILGTRDEDDDSGVYSDRDDQESDSILTQIKKSEKETTGNVVSLNALVGGSFDLPHHARIENKTAENMLEDIAEQYADFDLGHFVHGAEQAFAIVVEAFAEGDRETLQNLLSENVYKAFDQAIVEREKRQEIVSAQIHNMRKTDIIQVQKKGDTISVTVRFTAQETCFVKNNDGDILSGDPDKITEKIDVWVFGRDMTSEEPEWLVFETRDDVVEDHGVSLPDSGKD